MLYCEQMSLNVPLTPRQTQVVEFIEQFIAANGYFPRYDDIAVGVGLRSKSNVSRLMRVLEDKGVIERGDCPRATRLVASDDTDRRTATS